MEINEGKRTKFMENAGKRVNKVMHDIEILEPMARSSVYDFTKEDVEEMFEAMQNSLNTARAEFNRKFEGRAKSERKLFSFGNSNNTVQNNEPNINNVEAIGSTVMGDVTENVDVDNTVTTSVDNGISGIENV